MLRGLVEGGLEDVGVVEGGLEDVGLVEGGLEDVGLVEGGLEEGALEEVGKASMSKLSRHAFFLPATDCASPLSTEASELFGGSDGNVGEG